MNIEELRDYCLAKPGTTEDMPFDEVTLVFKVMGKIFAITSLEGELYINLKCDPELAVELREKYPAIKPGWHMNKKHWNTVIIDGSLTVKQLHHQINHSYERVVSGLTKKLRDELKGL